jgi:hypothetical protein
MGGGESPFSSVPLPSLSPLPIHQLPPFRTVSFELDIRSFKLRCAFCLCGSCCWGRISGSCEVYVCVAGHHSGPFTFLGVAGPLELGTLGTQGPGPVLLGASKMLSCH